MMTRSWESKGMSEDSAHGEIDERTPSWAATLDREEFRAELDRVCHAEWGAQTDKKKDNGLPAVWLRKGDGERNRKALLPALHRGGADNLRRDTTFSASDLVKVLRVNRRR